MVLRRWISSPTRLYIISLPKPCWNMEGQMGRPKNYCDRISARNPDTEQLIRIAQTERLYATLVHELNEDGTVKSVKIFNCTDLEFPAQDIWLWYNPEVSGPNGVSKPRRQATHWIVRHPKPTPKSPRIPFKHGSYLCVGRKSCSPSVDR